MKPDANKLGRAARIEWPRGSRTRFFSIVVIVAGLSILAIGIASVYLKPASPTPPDTNTRHPVAATQGKPARAKREKTTPAPTEVGLWENRSVSPSAAPAAPRINPVPRRAGSTAHAQQLVQRLSQFDFSRGTLTKEQAAEVNRLLQELAEQGVAAVPAIREFLAQANDINFDSIRGGDQVDYATLRIGMLDVLMQAGGTEALELSLQVLETSKDPLEIALLTRALEEQKPNQYREQALNAARNLLTLVTTTAWDGRDVTPLFEVLRMYGDASVVPDLEKAVKYWNYYATMALAGLPDGAGVPALIRLSQDPEVTAMGKGDYALRLLAQVANQYPDARNALIEQARLNQIPNTAWPTVAYSLAGMNISYGSQVLDNPTSTVVWSDSQINQRLALIDQVLSTTTNPAAIESLRTARSLLYAKLKK